MKTRTFHTSKFYNHDTLRKRATIEEQISQAGCPKNRRHLSHNGEEDDLKVATTLLKKSIDWPIV